MTYIDIAASPWGTCDGVTIDTTGVGDPLTHTAAGAGGVLVVGIAGDFTPLEAFAATRAEVRFNVSVNGLAELLCEAKFGQCIGVTMSSTAADLFVALGYIADYGDEVVAQIPLAYDLPTGVVIVPITSANLLAIIVDSLANVTPLCLGITVKSTNAQLLTLLKSGDITIRAYHDNTVTFTAGTGGTLTGDTPQLIQDGEDCTEVTAVPDAGYTFVNWTKAGVQYAVTPAISVTNVLADATYIAHFRRTWYVDSTNVGGDGSLLDPFTTVNAAIAAAADVDDIEVASGDAQTARVSVAESAGGGAVALSGKHLTVHGAGGDPWTLTFTGDGAVYVPATDFSADSSLTFSDATLTCIDADFSGRIVRWAQPSAQMTVSVLIDFDATCTWIHDGVHDSSTAALVVLEGATGTKTGDTSIGRKVRMHGTVELHDYAKLITSGSAASIDFEGMTGTYATADAAWWKNGDATFVSIAGTLGELRFEDSSIAFTIGAGAGGAFTGRFIDVSSAAGSVVFAGTNSFSGLRDCNIGWIRSAADGTLTLTTTGTTSFDDWIVPTGAASIGLLIGYAADTETNTLGEINVDGLRIKATGGSATSAPVLLHCGPSVKAGEFQHMFLTSHNVASGGAGIGVYLQACEAAAPVGGVYALRFHHNVVNSRSAFTRVATKNVEGIFNTLVDLVGAAVSGPVVMRDGNSGEYLDGSGDDFHDNICLGGALYAVNYNSHSSPPSMDLGTQLVDRNCYWPGTGNHAVYSNAEGAPATYDTITELRGLWTTYYTGQDAEDNDIHSVIADPMLVDSTGDDLDDYRPQNPACIIDGEVMGALEFAGTLSGGRAKAGRPFSGRPRYLRR
ncbi:MAG: hypothetical protein V1929_09180 [bacterium]